MDLKSEWNITEFKVKKCLLMDLVTTHQLKKLRDIKYTSVVYLIISDSLVRATDTEQIKEQKKT